MYYCESGTIVEATNPADIQAEIYAHGPMETAFDVYEDFFSYSSGIYQHVTGGYEGGHAVKTIGWGYDQATGLNYWIQANSWGAAWGEQGFFRIAQGQCGIDSTLYACTPKVSK